MKDFVPTLNTVVHYFRGLGTRLLYAIQVVLFLPLVVTFILLAPLWWVIVGREMPTPEWMERFNDGSEGM